MDAAGQVTQLGDRLLGAAATSSRTRSRSVCPVPSTMPPSFLVASPSFIATATICACAPSCKSRSIRRNLAAESSTTRARDRSSSRTRRGNGR
jgi:hypothetical protein